MSKTVLLAEQPQWCELIAVGKKKIDIRKSRPKLKTPFTVYIYDTKGIFDITLCPDLSVKSVKVADKGRGKVIGEFVCNRIDKIEPCFEYYSDGYDLDDDRLAETCLTRQELMDYGKGVNLYAWHISDLNIYDKPKELKEFKKACSPQSWCYVEGK